MLGVYPALRENVECEVAIIRGGVSGALIGYRLAEAGIDAVMLDKRDVGTGSTAANTSLLQYETDLTLTELSERMGEERAVAWAAADLGDGPALCVCSDDGGWARDHRRV